uniref:Protein ENHANCED DISEASE RESISTANCE 2 C-terminal domain-containing protein n=1 Tax=Kalanchoe fedtschenkoi TaxID=63787 RepID=A0A7N1A1B9_KALFE
MGGCGSTPRGCGMVKSRLKRKAGNRKRRRGGGKKNRGGVGNSRFSDYSNQSGAQDRSTPGSAAEEVWFEPASFFGSDSEEEFRSVPDDLVSVSGSEDASPSEFSPPKDATNKEQMILNIHQHHASELSKGVAHKTETPSKVRNQVPVDDVSSAAGKSSVRGKDDHSVLPHNCLPCLNTSHSSDRRRSGTSSPMSARNKVVPGHPSMSFEGQSHAALISSKMLQKRPVAGSQVPVCPIGKEMFDSWSPIDPSTFRVRGMNYLRDKRKEHASNKAAYYPFGVDVYLSHRKINHIARLVELPAISSSGELPSLLVVNVQIPLYPPTLFQNENDGEGMNVVMYFKLSDRFEKDVPLHFQESIRRLIDNEVEKVRGFPVDTTVPFRERLKILGRVANVDNLQLNVPQRKLMHAYNEKPILSRPQHEFYSGENYFEVDLDMHRFSYISRKGFDAFQDKLKICALDVGLTIQGNKAEELPEHVLCCLRINGIDHTNYQHLEPSQEIL